MAMSKYKHIASGQVIELSDAAAAGMTAFVKVEEPQEEAQVAASKSKPRATKSTSSKEGNK